MHRSEIVAALEEMADILELGQTAKPFEIMAYRNGARAVDDFDGDLEATIEAGTLTETPGIGKRLASVITELAQTGESEEHQKLRSYYPEGIFYLFRLRGLGPKKIGRLYHELDIDSIDSLRNAAESERIRELKGFGAKSEEKILDAIDRAARHTSYAPASEPLPEIRPTATGARFLGTSGYSYPEWKGAFFPEGLAADRFLEFYAQHLPSVEINNTFYRFPTPRLFEEWLPLVPPNFTFAVKANLRITHRQRLTHVEEVTDSFLRRCQRLGDRLGPVLFQLPPDFERDDAKLDPFLAILPPTVRCAIEFRHPTWFDDSIYTRLRAANVALVISDEESLPPPRVVTADFTYLRFRNDAYPDEACTDWHRWIQETSAGGTDVFGYLKHKEDGSSPIPILDRLGAASD
ncbi:MAG: DUF72 domain-containing protein [Planctomycetota bacterium]